MDKGSASGKTRGRLASNPGPWNWERWHRGHCTAPDASCHALGCYPQQTQPAPFRLSASLHSNSPSSSIPRRSPLQRAFLAMSISMFREASRLASFKPRRRSSVANNSKTSSSQKWPHVEPSPKSLANAGFFYNPTHESPDNVTCYLCNKSLDGWEPGDDPVSEHIRHSKNCGWAITAAIRAEEDDSNHKTDPNRKAMKKARFMTFGDNLWPHEGKPGWNPTVQKMVDGGWVYAPAKDMEDYTLCPYCLVSLDGWEQDDDPWVEHSKRAPGCFFFNYKPKRGGARGSRMSQVSMMSAQSERSQSVVSSRAGSEAETEPAPKPKKTRKASAPKKPRVRKASQKKTASREPSVESTLEPEEPVELPRKGRKRASSIVDNGPVILYDGGKDTDEENEVKPPPAKRRVTRSSLVRQSSVDLDGDHDMHSAVQTSVTKPKKGRQTLATKRSGRASVRNTSKAWTPDDEDLDRALALDLEQPLSDSDNFATFKKPFLRQTKRTTKSRTSLVVDQEMKDAPEGVLVPVANSTTRRSRSRTPAMEPESTKGIGKTPFKSFFKEQDQDFTLPVKIPKHLAEGDEAEQLRSPLKQRQEKVAERILRDYSADPADPAEEELPKPLVKKVRGRKKVVEDTQQAEERPKTKRGQQAKTKGRAGRTPSNSPVPPIMLEPEPVVEESLPPPVEEEPPIPKRGRKAKAPKPTKPQSRYSAVSLVSTIADDPPILTIDGATSLVDSSQASGDGESNAVSNDLDSGEISDAGSVVRHQIDHTEDREGQNTRRMNHIESNDDGDKSQVTMDKKVPNKIQKTASAKKGKRTKVAPTVEVEEENVPMKKEIVETQDDATEGDHSVYTNDRTLDNEDVADSTAALLQVEQEETQGLESSMTETRMVEVDTKRTVSFDEQSPRVENRNASEADMDEEPIIIEARTPLSPVRRQVRLKSPSTPSNDQKAKVISSNPWIAVDLDAVFSLHDDVNEEGGLTEAEKEMTVEEWVKWNAELTEQRFKVKAEKLITLFEEHGQRAIAAIEGIQTT